MSKISGYSRYVLSEASKCTLNTPYFSISVPVIRRKRLWLGTTEESKAHKRTEGQESKKEASREPSTRF